MYYTNKETHNISLYAWLYIGCFIIRQFILKMDVVRSESSIDKYAAKWLSFKIIKFSSLNILNYYRTLEKVSIKKVKLLSHLRFNETCIINNLLPTYTNVK